MMRLSALRSLNVCFLPVLFYANVIIVFHPFVVTAISQPKSKNFSFPAVIAFGDSILDTGNNNYIQTIVRSNFKPYGRDFIGGKSTGRFTNGRVPSDLYAEMLGIKESLPPYRAPNLKIKDLLTGVCFASAGAGYDPLTNELAAVTSIEEQLEMFKEYIGKLKAAVGEKRTAFILAKSLFLISMGSNDVSGTYFLTPFRKPMYSVQGYMNMLVNVSSNFLKGLYILGARKIGVLSLAPVGCAPLQRTIGGGTERKCVEEVNEAAKVYNKKLSSSIMTFSKSHPGARVVYLDTYTELGELIDHPNQHGFDEESGTCCGIGNFELGPLCNTFQLKICKDASKYVFWDSYHPTEHAYRILATEIINKTIDNFF